MKKKNNFSTFQNERETANKATKDTQTERIINNELDRFRQ